MGARAALQPVLREREQTRSRSPTSDIPSFLCNMPAYSADKDGAAMRICFASPLPLRGVGASAMERSVASSSPAKLQMNTQAKSAVGRRSVLTGAIASTVAFAGLLAPPGAQALSKKRILAKAGPEVVLDNGIRYREVNVGKGYSPQKGDTVAVHYSLFYDDLEVESSRESQGLAALPLGFSFGAESGPGSAMKVSKQQERHFTTVTSYSSFFHSAWTLPVVFQCIDSYPRSVSFLILPVARLSRG